MSRYFINLLFLLITCSVFSQSKPIDLNPKDTVEYKQSYGLGLGIDLSRIITGALDDNYKGFEILADYRLTQNLYLAAELGTEEKTSTFVPKTPSIHVALRPENFSGTSEPLENPSGLQYLFVSKY